MTDEQQQKFSEIERLLTQVRETAEGMGSDTGLFVITATRSNVRKEGGDVAFDLSVGSLMYGQKELLAEALFQASLLKDARYKDVLDLVANKMLLEDLKTENNGSPDAQK